MPRYTQDILTVTHHSAIQLLNELQKAFEKYGETNVTFEVEKEFEEYSDYVSVKAYLKCSRLMTDAENAIAEAKENADKNRILKYKKRQLEALKREFGELA